MSIIEAYLDYLAKSAEIDAQIYAKRKINMKGAEMSKSTAQQNFDELRAMPYGYQALVGLNNRTMKYMITLLYHGAEICHMCINWRDFQYPTVGKQVREQLLLYANRLKHQALSVPKDNVQVSWVWLQQKSLRIYMREHNMQKFVVSTWEYYGFIIELYFSGYMFKFTAKLQTHTGKIKRFTAYSQYEALEKALNFIKRSV